MFFNIEINGVFTKKKEKKNTDLSKQSIFLFCASKVNKVIQTVSMLGLKKKTCILVSSWRLHMFALIY